MSDLWHALKSDARTRLTQRDYTSKSLAERLGTSGVEVGELIAAERGKLVDAWIPGVELFGRRIFPQRHRGFFGEFARQDDGRARGHRPVAEAVGDGADVCRHGKRLSHPPAAHPRRRRAGGVVPALVCR